MNEALYIAATGMQAHQSGVDTIANNLANVTTPGYKASRIGFSDLVYRGLLAGDTDQPAPVLQGSGVAIGNLAKLFNAGQLRQTDNPLDLAIPGDGFLEVALADGSVAYTRGGSLRVNADGFLTTADGDLLKPSIHIGRDAKAVTILADGRVLVNNTGNSGNSSGISAGSSGRSAGNIANASEVGRLELAHFTDNGGLRPLGRNLYQASARSGEAEIGRPGEDGFGVLAPGYIEESNVNLVDEMVNLLVAQRAYGMNVKVIQAADEMLAMSNNLRR
jgi:flagellar basal-body rod protein FlgG